MLETTRIYRSRPGWRRYGSWYCVDGIRGLNPRRDEKQQFGRALDRLRAFEQITDQRNAPEPRHLKNVKRILIEQDTAKHRSSAIWNENVGLCSLRRNGRDTVN